MMKKIMLLISIFMLNAAHAQEDVSKILLQTALNSVVETYGQLIADTLDYQREIKKALPLVGRKKKLGKIACDQIEMVTSYGTSLLEETSREVKTVDIPNASAMSFSEAIVGVMNHSKKATAKCKKLDEALESLYAAERDANFSLDIINRLED